MERGSKGPQRASQPLLSSRIGLISLSAHTAITSFKYPHLQTSTTRAQPPHTFAPRAFLCSAVALWADSQGRLSPGAHCPTSHQRCCSKGPRDDEVSPKTTHQEVDKSSATQSKPTPKVPLEPEVGTSPRPEPFLCEPVGVRNAQQGAFTCLVLPQVTLTLANGCLKWAEDRMARSRQQNNEKRMRRDQEVDISSF